MPYLSMLLLAFAQRQGQLHQPPPGAGNVYIVIADDVALADLSTVDTPGLDALAAMGCTYTRAYANPTCSPSRRSLYTGMYYARENGSPCADPTGEGLTTEMVTLPDLTSMESTLFGKWHVGSADAGWPFAPQALGGFDHWLAGHPDNLSSCGGTGYTRWTRVDDGVVTTEHGYEPRVLRDRFEAFWMESSAPRMFVLAGALAHGPFSRPPSDMLPPGYPTLVPDDRSQFEAMIVALDRIVLLTLLPKVRPGDLVVFVGDNGTPATIAPNGAKAKGTTFERGIHVPLIVCGPGIAPGTTSDRLTHITDVFATVAGYYGVPRGPIDGISVRGVGHENVVCGVPGDVCALGADRLKLRRLVDHEELYDLFYDPDENADVIADPSYGTRKAELEALLDAFEARP